MKQFWVYATLLSAFVDATAVIAQDITLSLVNSGITITGLLQGYDGEF